MTPPSTNPPGEGLLERVLSVTPLIAEKAAEAEEARRPLDEVIEALKATGVFRSYPYSLGSESSLPSRCEG